MKRFKKRSTENCNLERPNDKTLKCIELVDMKRYMSGIDGERFVALVLLFLS